MPRFTVDLSRRPSKRHVHIALHLRDQVHGVGSAPLLDNLLRKLWSDEETAELRGISRVMGIKMHLLVVFNVALDLLMGCTSAGVLAHEGGQDRMMHLRTLDWGIDSLRLLVIHIDSMREEGGPVIASSETYFGYVGVLTAVRRGLSLSLNFRPRHLAPSKQYRWHQLMVLLGKRQSITSRFRGVLLTSDKYLDCGDATGQKGMIRYIRRKLAGEQSTAARLMFTTPDAVYVMEKDYKTAKLMSFTVYDTIFNHDASDEEVKKKLRIIEQQSFEDTPLLDAVLATSVLRKMRLDEVWQLNSGPCMCANRGQQNMINDELVTSGLTHYAVIMDPLKGIVSWVKLYPPPTPKKKQQPRKR
ncbi:hypothetical protein GQ53DRAFT_776438 [Thozetella sp. PMI_491]|nr:hypothetical protein GQ53DRAFT_776438 [Thozetella sp. PMI_491]